MEILQYNLQKEPVPPAINRPGFAHIAFEVDDLEGAHEAVIQAGGGEIGKTVPLEISGAGTVKIVYLTDIEGNIIELQHWSHVVPKADCNPLRTKT